MNELPQVHHGQFECNAPPPYAEGVVAILTCHEGYGIRGTLQFSVESDRGVLQWNPPSATCLPVAARLPIAIHGEFKSPQPYFEGNVASLVCDAGFATKVPIQSRVVAGGAWSPPSAECLPLDPPLAPLHGQFKLDSPPPYSEGQVARLACHEGFGTKTAESTLVRNTRGELEWTPADCVPVLAELPTAKQGTFTCSHPPPYFEKDRAFLKCDPGRRTNNNAWSVAVRRGALLQWDPASGNCSITVGCPVPRSLENGSQFYDGRYPFATEIQYACDEGYVLNQDTDRFWCSAEGSWQIPISSELACVSTTQPASQPASVPQLAPQPAFVPQAAPQPALVPQAAPAPQVAPGPALVPQAAPAPQAMQCPELQAPQHGLMICNDRFVGSEASYACDPGYEIIQGRDLRTCRSNGRWSGAEVICGPGPPCEKLPEMDRFPMTYESPFLILECEYGREEYVQCNPDGQWSKLPPYCETAPKPPVAPFFAPEIINPKQPSAVGIWILLAFALIGVFLFLFRT